MVWGLDCFPEFSGLGGFVIIQLLGCVAGLVSRLFCCGVDWLVVGG